MSYGVSFLLGRVNKEQIILFDFTFTGDIL